MIAAAATLLAACNNDENAGNDGPVAAQVYAEIGDMAATRATATTWEADDVIGISTIDGFSAEAPKTKYANVPYIYTDGNFTFDVTASGKTQIYFEETKEVTFRAYHPYKSALANDGIITGISTTDQANQKEFDYLFATGAIASQSSPNLNFVKSGEEVGTSFQHKMSQLAFTFQVASGQTNVIDLTELTSLTIKDVVNSGSFNTTDGSATVKASPASGDTDITTATFTNNNTKASVILFPQDAPMSDSKFKIELTLDGVDYSAELTLPTEIANGKFTAGVSVAYTITIQKTGLTVNSAQISGWKQATGAGGTAEM